MGYCVTPEYRWSEGVIPFTYEKGITSEFAQLIDNAMVRWQKLVNAGGRTYIRFKLRYLEIPYISISTTPSGSTIAGSVGTNDLSEKGVKANFIITANDEGIAAIPHELGHTIGLAHEHDRHDSDLILDKRDLFYRDRLKAQKLSFTRYVPHGSYDPASIMHYKNPPGYLWKPGKQGGTKLKAEQVRAGTGTWAPSAGDIATVRALYDGQVVGSVVSLSQAFNVQDVNLYKDVPDEG